MINSVHGLAESIDVELEKIRRKLDSYTLEWAGDRCDNFQSRQLRIITSQTCLQLHSVTFSLLSCQILASCCQVTSHDLSSG